VFEFLLGLGIYFGTKKEYHKYSLTDVFDIITQYAEKNYPEDGVLKKLIAIDYYLHFKVRPQSLYFKGLEKKEQNKFIEKTGLNYHKYRYIVLPLDFNFLQENIDRRLGFENNKTQKSTSFFERLSHQSKKKEKLICSLPKTLTGKTLHCPKKCWKLLTT
jgi:hypothetical protein